MCCFAQAALCRPFRLSSVYRRGLKASKFSSRCFAALICTRAQSSEWALKSRFRGDRNHQVGRKIKAVVVADRSMATQIKPAFWVKRAVGALQRRACFSKRDTKSNIVFCLFNLSVWNRGKLLQQIGARALTDGIPSTPDRLREHHGEEQARQNTKYVKIPQRFLSKFEPIYPLFKRLISSRWCKKNTKNTLVVL